jgi:HSP20 family protein
MIMSKQIEREQREQRRDLERAPQQGRELTSGSPFSEIARWEQQMERLLADFMGGRTSRLWDDRWTQGLAMREPAIDLYEDKDEFVVKAELPGLSKEDVQIDISDHTLILRGEKKKEEEIKDRNYYRAERAYGAFVRTIPLPNETDSGKARASFKNGVLEIRLPKTEEAKKKEIKVNVE